jgi:hypothetical protein
VRPVLNTIGGETVSLTSSRNIGLTPANPIIGTVTVGDGVTSVAASNLGITSGQSPAVYTNDGYTTAGPVSLPAGQSTHAYIRAASSDDAAAFVYYDITVTKLNTEKELTSVAGKSVTPAGTGTSSSPKTDTVIILDGTKNSILTSEIEVSPTAVFSLYTDAAFTQSAGSAISITESDSNMVYIKVVAEDSTETYYAITVIKDSTAPAVLTVTPSGIGASVSGSVVITFSEAMDEGTAGTVQLNSLGALGAGSWSAGSTVYTASYSGLSLGTLYTVHISGFKDARSNALAADSTHSFTPADTVTYTAVQEGGTGGSPNVKTTTDIKLTFSEAVSGLTTGAITVTNGTGQVVTGALTPASGSHTEWTLSVSSVAASGDLSVAVTDWNGYIVSGGAKTVAVYKDAAAPTAQVQYRTSAFRNFLNTISFGYWFRETVLVNIQGADPGGDGLAASDAVQYKVTATAETDESNITGWTTGTGFTQDPDGKYILYVKVTDKNGNYNIYKDGMVVFTDSEQTAQDKTFIRLGDGDISDIAVTLHDNTVAGIVNTTMGGLALTPGSHYTVDGSSGLITLKNAYLRTLNASVTPYTFTVSYLPQGTTDAAVVITDAADTTNTPAATSFTVTVNKAAQTALTVGQPNPIVRYGEIGRQLETAGGSGTGAVTFSLVSGTAARVAADGTLTITGVGTIRVKAEKQTDDDYLGIESAEADIEIYEADKGALIMLRDAVELALGRVAANLHEENYLASAAAALRSAIASANLIIQNPTVTQAEVDAAYAVLEDAYKALAQDHPVLAHSHPDGVSGLGETVRIRVKGHLADVTALTLDDKNYTLVPDSGGAAGTQIIKDENGTVIGKITSGSAIVTFEEDFIDGLGNGTYALDLTFIDVLGIGHSEASSVAKSEILIKRAPESGSEAESDGNDTGSGSAKTGDDMNMLLYSAAMILAFACLAVRGLLLRIRRKAMLRK